jgi:hypothetical protein
MLAVGRRFGLVVGDESFGRQPRERTVDRVVLGVGGDDVVAFLEQPLDRDVEAVGGVEGQDDAVRALGVQQPRERLAAALDPLLRLDGHPVARAPGIAGGLPRELVHRAVDALRLRPGGGGVVEVDHRRDSIAVARDLHLKKRAPIPALRRGDLCTRLLTSLGSCCSARRWPAAA